ncbi:hypothetical protein FORMB_23290 [Formosa sp. Hel1_33_131]|nr:hypothetical protein FORMB_23290 [Formosa sp. Hel1_33_131]
MIYIKLANQIDKSEDSNGYQQCIKKIGQKVLNQAAHAGARIHSRSK